MKSMKKKTKTGLVWLLALSLLISVAASTVAVANRMQYYTEIADVNSMIPLMPEYVTVEDLRAAYAAKAEGAPITTSSVAYSAPRISPVNVTYCAPVEPSSSFFAMDDNTVWGTNTPVEIFKTSYEDGHHNITVASSNGDKVIAPGTENSYVFKLKNTLPVDVDYTLTVKAYFTPDDVVIPVTCRLSRYDGHWVAGDPTTWVDVPTFDGATDVAYLYPDSYVTYVLDWQWPFDGNDALDTALADRAMTEDLTLTIEISTIAEAYLGGFTPIFPPIVPPVVPPTPPVPGEPVPGEPLPEEPLPVEPLPELPGVGEGLPPKTGDESHPVLWMVLAAVSLILMLILLFWKDKDEDEDEKTTHAEAINREQIQQTGS